MLSLTTPAAAAAPTAASGGRAIAATTSASGLFLPPGLTGAFVRFLEHGEVRRHGRSRAERSRDKPGAWGMQGGAPLPKAGTPLPSRSEAPAWGRLSSKLCFVICQHGRQSVTTVNRRLPSRIAAVSVACGSGASGICVPKLELGNEMKPARIMTWSRRPWKAILRQTAGVERVRSTHVMGS